MLPTPEHTWISIKLLMDPVSIRSNRTGGKFVLLILETFDVKISIKCEKKLQLSRKNTNSFVELCIVQMNILPAHINSPVHM